MQTENKIYLTKEGLKFFEKEYQELKKRRDSKAKEEAYASSSQTTDPEFTNIQEDLNFLEARIEEIENILNNYTLIKTPPRHKRNEVGLGATVEVEVDGQIDEFTIVGSLEANPVLGKISNESPVGKALLGKKEGEEIKVQSTIVTAYKIRKITYKI